MLCSLQIPVQCKYFRLVVSGYCPYTLLYIVSTSVKLCNAMVLTPPGILWVLQFSWVMLWSLKSPVYCENFSLVVSCYGPYILQYFKLVVTLWTLHPPVQCEYCSIFISCYGPYIPLYNVSTSVYLCHVMILTNSGKLWVLEFSCVTLWSFQFPGHPEYFSLVGSCSGS